MSSATAPKQGPDAVLPPVVAEMDATLVSASFRGGKLRLALQVDDIEPAMIARLAAVPDGALMTVVFVDLNPERPIPGMQGELGYTDAAKVAAGVRLVDALVEMAHEHRDFDSGEILGDPHQIEPPILPQGTEVGQTRAEIEGNVVQLAGRDPTGTARAAGKAVRQGARRRRAQDNK